MGSMRLLLARVKSTCQISGPELNLLTVELHSVEVGEVGADTADDVPVSDHHAFGVPS